MSQVTVTDVVIEKYFIVIDSDKVDDENEKTYLARTDKI